MNHKGDNFDPQLAFEIFSDSLICVLEIEDGEQANLYYKAEEKLYANADLIQESVLFVLDSNDLFSIGGWFLHISDKGDVYAYSEKQIGCVFLSDESKEETNEFFKKCDLSDE